jgi:NTE family protein
MTPPDWGLHLAAQLDELRADGSVVEVIAPGDDADRMFGPNAMDPSLRPAAARAGYDQGTALAELISEAWR